MLTLNLNLNLLMKIPLNSLILACFILQTFGVNHNTYILRDDHETNDWRLRANRPSPPQMNKRIVWVCHDLVGIGLIFIVNLYSFSLF